MKRFSSLFLALAATATTLIACSKKDAPVPNEAFVGTWTQISETLTTEPKNGGAKTVVTNPLARPAVLTFTADGKVNGTVPVFSDTLVTGTYNYVHTYRTLTLVLNGKSSDVTVSEINATKMVWFIAYQDKQNDYLITETFTR